MPEILTESFCERCGTRYTFESAAPKGARLKGLKVMSRGLRNFVMSDDTSMDEAMAAARNETDREVTTQQLDAFHKTFNFCMSCRQYTCSNCWNEVEGRCLSCAPYLGQDVLAAPFPNLDPSHGLPTGTATETHNGHDHPELPAIEPMAWPTSDLMREEEAAAVDVDDVIAQHAADAAAAEDEPLDEQEAFDPLARLAALDGELEQPIEGPQPELAEPELAEPELAEPELAEPEAEPEAEAEEPIAAEPAVADEPEPEPVIAEPVVAEPVVVEPVAEAPVQTTPPASPPADDRAAAAAVQTGDLLRRFRPGQSLDDAIAAYERTQAAADALAMEPAPTEPVAPEPEPQPEPIAVAPEPEPEPAPIAAAPVIPPAVPDLDRVAATAAPQDVEPAYESPAFEPPTEPVAAEARDDVVPQPTWQIMAPDATGDPQWPAPPAWPGAQPSEGLPFLGRPAQPSGGIDALWAESAREVANTSPVPTTAPGQVARPAGGVQPCVSCGLSLSANARFCRRCGTRQD